MSALAVVDRTVDGTPLYAVRGELSVDVDEERVQCHLCGGWYRALAPTHLSRTHGVTADEYRELVGLRPRHSLWAPDLVEAHGARLRSRIAAEPRLRAALAAGRALAQRGELQRRARSRLAERRVSLERERQLAISGARLGNARAAAFRRDRERRAVELGFADLAAYYQRRYREQRRRLDQIVAELGCAESAVRNDLQRLGLGPTGRARTAHAVPRARVKHVRECRFQKCARSRARMGSSFEPLAELESRDVFRAVSKNERPAGPGSCAGAGVAHRRGQRCRDAGMP